MQVSLCLYHIFNTETVLDIGARDIMVIYSLHNPNEEKCAAYRRKGLVLTSIN